MDAHWLDGGQALDAATLEAEGVHYRRLDLDPAKHQPEIDVLKAKQGYIEQDEVALAPDTPDLDAICAKFLPEHRHSEDEVRFVLEGEGVFDIRSTDDRWMRVKVEAGDLLVVPADRHHRFFLTDTKRIRCVRLFQDMSGWVPHYRGEAAE
ncbi:MAG: cupin domain-containing protein [Sandaracinaceae bacterium]